MTRARAASECLSLVSRCAKRLALGAAGALLLAGLVPAAQAQEPPAPVQLSVNPPTVQEGVVAVATEITVTATITNAVRFSEPTPVQVTVAGGTATMSEDFTVSAASFTITIPAGAESGTGAFQLTPLDDDHHFEGTETVVVSGAGDGLSVSGAEIGIVDGSVGVTLSVFSDEASGELREGDSRFYRVRVNLSRTSPVPIPVRITVGRTGAQDAATPGVDFERVPDFVITVPPNAPSESTSPGFRLMALADAIAEADERVYVGGEVLMGNYDRMIDDCCSQGGIVIQDAHALRISVVEPTEVQETDAATTVRVRAEFATGSSNRPSTAGAMVRFKVGSGTATRGLDFTVAEDEFVVPMSGYDPVEGSFVLTPLRDDVQVERRETVAITAEVEGAPLAVLGPAFLNIANVPNAVTLSVRSNDGSFAGFPEADERSYRATATLDYAREEDTVVTVTVGASGSTATPGVDFERAPDFDITIPAGRTSATGDFTLTTLADTELAESNESVVLGGVVESRFADTRIQVNPTPSQTTDTGATDGIIITDRAAIQLMFDGNAGFVAEDDGATPMVVRAEILGGGRASGAVEVTVTVTDGTATAGEDYTVTPERFTIIIPDGSDRGDGHFTLTPIEDTNGDEADETVAFRGSAVGYGVVGAEVSILNRAPLFLSAAPDDSLFEGESYAVTVRASLAGRMGSATDTEVDVTVRGDDAVAGEDYIVDREQFTIVIPAGEDSATETIRFEVLTDAEVEGAEHAIISGVTPDGVVLASHRVQFGDIGPVTLSLMPERVEEGDSVEVTVTASLPQNLPPGFAPPDPVAVTVAGATATEGVDYTVDRNMFTIAIPAGETSATETFTLDAIQDVDGSEPTETVAVTGSVPRYGVVGAELRINDSSEVFLSASPAALFEGQTRDLEVTARLRNPRAEALDVRVTVTDATAVAGLDYTVDKDMFTITIPAGETSATEMLRLTALPDVESEVGTERLTLIGDTGAAGLAVSSYFLVIGDRSPIQLTVEPDFVMEGGSETFTVTATMPPAIVSETDTIVAVTVDGGTATAGVDFTAPPDFTITIPAHATSATGSFTLTTAGDADGGEGAETVLVSGTTANFGVADAAVRIVDVAEIVVGLSPAVLFEGDRQTIQVGLSLLAGAPTRNVPTEVQITVAGESATAGADYTVSRDRFTITIPAGASAASGEFELTVLQDDEEETGPETVRVSGSTDAAVGLSVSDLRIFLHDQTPINLAVNQALVTEGADQAIIVTAAFPAGVTRRNADTEVEVMVGGGTATAGADYEEIEPFPIVIPRGQNRGTGRFVLRPTPDSIDPEADETVLVTGASERRYRVREAQLSIRNITPIVLSVAPRTLLTEGEGATTLTVTATLAAAAAANTVVAVTVADGTATAGVGNDYTVSDDSFDVAIPMGATSGNGTFTLTPLADNRDEGAESIAIRGSVEQDGFAVVGLDVYVADVDPALTMTLGTRIVREGAEYDVPVTVSLPGGSRRVVDTPVEVTLIDDTSTKGVDYILEQDPFIITIPAGENSVTEAFRMTVLLDAVEEEQEFLAVRADAGAGFSTVEVRMGILNTPQLTFTVTPSSIAEGDNATEVTIRATIVAPALRDIVITGAISDGAATVGEDYRFVSGDSSEEFTLGINMGATESSTYSTFIVPLRDLDGAEGDETVAITGIRTIGPTDEVVDVFPAALTIEDVPPAVVTLSVAPQEVTEGDENVQIQVTATLDAPDSQNLRVFAVLDTDGAAGSTAGMAPDGRLDFRLSGNTIIIPIPAGETSAAMGFGAGSPGMDVLDDDLVEGDEFLLINGAVRIGNSGANSNRHVVIPTRIVFRDTDRPLVGVPPVALRVNPAAVMEGDGATAVTVTADFGNGVSFARPTPISIAVVAGTATATDDYTVDRDSFVIVIPENQSSATGAFNLTPLADDDDAEAGETVLIRGSPPQGSTFTITDASLAIEERAAAVPPPPGAAGISLGVAPAAVAEGDAETEITVTAELDAGTAAANIDVRVDIGGSGVANLAEKGVDYTVSADFFTITIPAGGNRGTGAFRLTPRADSDNAEGDEVVLLSGSPPAGFTVRGASLTINDMDIIPVTLGVDPDSVMEGDEETITVTAVLEAARAAAVTVAVTVADGTAAAGVGNDYTVSTNRFNITIAAGDVAGTGMFDLEALTDDQDEGGETVVVSGTAGAGFAVTSAQVAIIDAVAVPIALEVAPVAVAEGEATPVVVTATMPAALAAAVVVGVTVTDGTAAVDDDYAVSTDRFDITIAAGDVAGAETFNLAALRDDDGAEADETVIISGTAGAGFTVAATQVAITDVDPIAVTLTTDPAAVAEGDAETGVTVTATLDATVSENVVVAVTVADGTATVANDYAVGAGRFDITIPAGAAAATGAFNLTPLRDDDGAEADETVVVAGTAGAGFTVVAAQVAITDVDPIPITLSVDPSTVAEGDAAVAITVTATLGAMVSEDVAVAVTVADGTATVADDYTVSADRFDIIIPVGDTAATGEFDLIALADARPEVDETVAVGGTAAAGFTVAGAAVAIENVDAITLRAAPPRVLEGDTVRVAVGASLPQGVTRAAPVSVTVAIGGGTAVAGAGNDYTVSANSLVITIPAGASGAQGMFDLVTLADDETEVDETIVLSGTADEFNVISGEIAILSDGAVTLQTAPGRVLEGGIESITVTASLPARVMRQVATRVTVTAAEGTATAVTDYTVDRDMFTITIPAGAGGATETFTMTTLVDADEEEDETVIVSGTTERLRVESATVTILNSSPVTLAVTPARLVEGATETLQVTATLLEGITRPVATLVTVTVAAGSAAAGADYRTERDSFTIAIPADAPAAAGAFTLSALVDNHAEEDETVRLLATLGRSAAVIDETQVVIQDLAATERLREVNETILPELARAMSAGARNAVTECIDEALEGSGRVQLGGQSSAAGLVMSGIRALAGETEASWRRALGGTALAWSLDADDEGEARATGVTLCAGGEYRDLKDESGRDPVDWDGFVRSVHGGGNIALGDKLLVGAALSWFDGRFDYVDGRGRGKESQHKTHMLGVHPYLGWSWAEHARVWAMAGYSWGETTLEDFSAGELLRAESDSAMSSVAAGGNVRLAEQEGARAAFDLKAETWATWMKLDGNEHLEEMNIEVTGARLALEGSYEFALANAGRLRPELEVGARYDGGDGAAGFGVETLAGLHYAQGRRHAVLRGRTLLAHEGDLHDWGAHGSLALESCAGGRGWSASLGMDYGALGGNRAQLWDNGMRGASAAQAPAAGLRTRAEAGYGIGARQGLLTPYGALDLGQGGDHAWTLGARARLGAGWSLHFKGERREYADSAADHRLWLDLEVPLSGDLLR